MPGVHRLQHVDGLRAAHLTDDDAIGPHAQRVTKQVADRDFAATFEVRRTGLQPDEVFLVELEFGGVIVNEAPTFRADQMPYGGIKASGNTKEGPAWAVHEMTEERLVVLSL